METAGLIQALFDSSIRPFTLAFKDRDMESEYMRAKERFEFLSPSAKCFLYSVILGFMAINIIDIISALGVNPNYSSSFWNWMAYLCIVPGLLLEVLMYFCKRVNWLRGTSFTVLGCVSFFWSSFFDAHSPGYYPVFNSQYELVITACR